LGDRVLGKFILIAFGFLGFAFYELSGGADFDGEALRLSRVDTTTVKTGLPKVTLAQAQKNTLQDDTVVSRALINLASAQKLDVTDIASAKPQNTQAQITQTSFVVGQQQDVASAIILPSLIAQPDADFDVQAPLATIGQDLRLVTGNLVNVRGGPGTEFDVVGKLARGATVEVLAENGDGWVEMRSTNGEIIGWMADFLLNEG
jgi:hypothetical protein